MCHPTETGVSPLVRHSRQALRGHAPSCPGHLMQISAPHSPPILQSKVLQSTLTRAKPGECGGARIRSHARTCETARARQPLRPPAWRPGAQPPAWRAGLWRHLSCSSYPTHKVAIVASGARQGKNIHRGTPCRTPRPLSGSTLQAQFLCTTWSCLLKQEFVRSSWRVAAELLLVRPLAPGGGQAGRQGCHGRPTC